MRWIEMTIRDFLILTAIFSAGVILGAAFF